MDHVLKKKEAVELQLQISEKFSEKANKFYRESLLREQLKVIREELNEGKGERSKKDKDYSSKIEEAEMPPETREVALEELDKLEAKGTHGSEYNVLRNLLNLLVHLPWKKAEVKPVDLGVAKQIPKHLDLPYDLSDIFFIATANAIESIPRPLLDRMEVIQISGYTLDEKFHIGKNHLIPVILEENGLTIEQMIVEDDVLHKIISNYTLEAGVRGLKNNCPFLQE